ncbi:MAG: V-type ATP synthase subunit A [Nitrospiraceae bacterium]|nr:MAG: V-type ATP synthase subunit A [Nitrospiraceae bacterium]
MKGKITGISGPTVSVDVKGLKLYEMVLVGSIKLTGEVVRVEENRTIVQVYEDMRGLAVGEPVQGSGASLTVTLGPGLISGIFDGLQRPLKKLWKESGPFIRQAPEMNALDSALHWEFHPLRKAGDKVLRDEMIGYVQEGVFRHFISGGEGGVLARIHDGKFSIHEPVGIFEDGKEIFAYQRWPVRIPRPYRKKLPSSGLLVTGQRVIDFLYPVAKGGTAVIPGGFGTGKTILEQAIAKFSDVDIVMYAGCGERGNEMAEMIEEFEQLSDHWTKRKLLERTVLCVNTSNMPVAAREASIYTAVTMAEYYRDLGLHVLFLADSISRWAEALREISTSLEEMPGEEGYPTYLSSRLASFIERAGLVETMDGRTGSISMILAVSPPGGDLTEPVTQAGLRTAGAFLMLDTKLAHRRHFPAVNWFQSYSLYGKDLAKFCSENYSPEWEALLFKCRDILQREEQLREVAEIIGFEGLQDSDRLCMHAAEKIRSGFLSQNAYSDDAFSPPAKTLSAIKHIMDFFETASEKLKQGVPLTELLK